MIEIDPPQGKYRTIVIDPPWPVRKGRRTARPNQIAMDYPVMTLDAITNIKIPVDPNGCHVYLWATQRFLPAAFDIIKQWGLHYSFTMTWHKPGGFQPFNLPQFNSEFVVFASIGNLNFVDTKAFPTCFTAPRAGHSVKPSEFYDLVRRVSPGPRIDMFARRELDGFDVWGDEV